jgi:hypothetical protein
MDHGLEAVGPDELPALRERLHVAAHHLEAVERRPLGRKQLVVHALEVLADDMQAGLRQEVVDVSDPPGAGILDRNHRQLGPAVAHRGEGVLEGRTGQGGHLGMGTPAGHVGVGAVHALKGDQLL